MNVAASEVGMASQMPEVPKHFGKIRKAGTSRAKPLRDINTSAGPIISRL